MNEEDIDISQLSFEQQVAFLMRDLPEPVQKFLQSPERNQISLELARKYNLHADAAGVFEKAYILMLLGVNTPDEFVQDLRDEKIDEATIRGLANDVNEKVFKRLREEERDGVAPVPQRPQVPVMEVGSRAPIPANLPGQETLPTPIAPPTAPTAPLTPPDAIPPPQIPPVSYAPPVQPAPAYQAPAPIPIYSNPVAPPPAPAPAPRPAVRTMESDVELITQGYQPSASEQPFQNPLSQPAYTPAPAPPLPSPLPPPMPTYQAPVQPIAAPELTIPAYPPPAMASVHRTPIDRTHERDPIRKEYGSDPYREPIEV
jgi:hypothetical protein